MEILQALASGVAMPIGAGIGLALIIFVIEPLRNRGRR